MNSQIFSVLCVALISTTTFANDEVACQSMVEADYRGEVICVPQRQALKEALNADSKDLISSAEQALEVCTEKFLAICGEELGAESNPFFNSAEK